MIELALANSRPTLRGGFLFLRQHHPSVEFETGGVSGDFVSLATGQCFSRGVGNTELELPVLCPRFRLFILADLQQNAVRAFSKWCVCDVLIDHFTGVVDVVGHH